MNNSDYKIRWGWWIAAIAVVPFIVWIITLIPTPYNPDGYLVDEKDWVAFFGGYTGACIGILMTLFVLRSTLKQNASNLRTTITENKNNLNATLKQNQVNHRELVELQNTTNNENERLNRENRELNERLNREQRQLQINTARYVQDKADIEKQKQMFDEIYRTFDYQRFAIATNYLFSGSIDYANQLLLSINRDVEMCGAKADLYLPKFEDGEAEVITKCRETFRQTMIAYGAMVNEFIFVISLLNNFKNKPLLVNDIVDFVSRSYEAYKKHIKLSPELDEAYNNENIYEDLLKLQHRATYQETINDINNIVLVRLEKVINAHVRKGELLDVTKTFIEYKEFEAKKILTEKLEY